ncbi:MAG: AAA family ATPase [Chloroflexota bacterium]|nr:AAA family ATPase [Chloroflexota bacterium]
MPGQPSTLPPVLVGREREQALLRECLSAARAGQGSLVLIGGEAGIGKTALAEVVCREASERGIFVLVGRCYDLTETPPYGPWVELFEQYRRSGDGPSPPDAFAQRGTVGEVASQATLFQQVLDFFTALTAAGPLMLLLDDAHWMDVASLDLLRFMARSLSALPLLLVVTYRVDELTRRHPLSQLLPLLVRESDAQRIDLHPLDEMALHALVTQRYGLGAADGDRLVSHLQTRAGGNALFVGELLRALEENAVLGRGDDGWRLGDLERSGVPALLRQVIDARVERFGEEAYRLLGIATVIGQDVPFPIWAALTGEDEETLIAVVEAASATRLVEPTPDGAGWRFVHALIRESLYEGIVPLRRRTLHRQVGEALARQPYADPDAIAYHYQQAGDARAVAWLIAAGERAENAYAHLTAATRYETALALMPEMEGNARGWLFYRIARLRLPGELTYIDEAVRLAEATGDPVLAAVAQFHRGYARCHRGERRAGVAELTVGADAIMALSAEERERLRALPGQNTVEATAPHGRVVIWTANTGRYAQSLALAKRWILPFAGNSHAHEGTGALASGWAGLAYTYAALGRVEEACAAFTRARADYERAGHHIQILALTSAMLRQFVLAYEADRPEARRQTMAIAEIAYLRASDAPGGPLHCQVEARLAFLEGRWDDEHFRRMEAFAARSPKRSLVSHSAYCLLGLRHGERGDVSQAWECIHMLLPDGPTTEAEEAYAEDTLQLQQLAVSLSLAENNLPAAHAWLDAHDAWLTWSGAVRGQSERHALWTQYHQQAGDPGTAREHADLALFHASEPRQPLALLAAHRNLGELDTEAGRFDHAATHLHGSLALADACAAPYERALTLLAMAELRAATGEVEVARTLLAEGTAICGPLGAKPALARADALSASLTAVRPTPAYPADLTAREVEVLWLLAAGRTAREIGVALFVSEHTVRAHIRHIYTKTDTDSRAAITAFAFRHGLGA